MNQVSEEDLRKRYEFEGYIHDGAYGVENSTLFVFYKEKVAGVHFNEFKKYKITLEELPDD